MSPCIIPNQLWKEEQKIWEVTPPKNKELLVVSSLEQGQQADKPEGADRTGTKHISEKTSDQSREVLEGF